MNAVEIVTPTLERLPEYKDALERIPEPKEKYAPWGVARPADPNKTP